MAEASPRRSAWCSRPRHWTGSRGRFRLPSLRRPQQGRDRRSRDRVHPHLRARHPLAGRRGPARGRPVQVGAPELEPGRAHSAGHLRRAALRRSLLHGADREGLRAPSPAPAGRSSSAATSSRSRSGRSRRTTCPPTFGTSTPWSRRWATTSSTSTGPEFNKQPFTRSWIFGVYGGRVIFWEEMVSRGVPLSKPQACVAHQVTEGGGGERILSDRLLPPSQCNDGETTVSMEAFTFRVASPPQTAKTP